MWGLEGHQRGYDVVEVRGVVCSERLCWWWGRLWYSKTRRLVDGGEVGWGCRAEIEGRFKLVRVHTGDLHSGSFGLKTS